jgi:serine/threonine protein kinase/WD40 repeat protein
MSVSTSRTCTGCGAHIAAETTLGLCPACTLRLALNVGGTSAGFDFSGESAGFVHGDYELLEEIGRGGMGVVFRARQKSLDRIVALKVLSAGMFVSEDGRRRLLSEAAAAARLQHPNIVAVYATGELDGHPFYAMELVAGRTLAQVVQAGPVPPKRAALWLKKIAGAVQYAHSHNVLHRDLKPSNILLDTAGEPRIADFGLAKILDSTEAATLTGSVLGSPAYMPPEQAAGRTAEMGPAADVYSLGAMFYELLTGRPPFQGASPQAVIEQVKNVEPIAPRRLNPGVPEDLNTMVLKCLEKNPVQRYASAQALAGELERFLNGQPVRARPVSPAEKIWRWSRRHPLPSVLAAISIVLLLVVLIVLSASSERVRLSRDEAQGRLADSLLSEAHALRLAGEPGWRGRSLEDLAEAHQRDPQDHLTFQLRNEAIAALARPDLARRIVTNLPPMNNLLNVCFDEAFERIAWWNPAAGAVVIHRVADGKLLATCRTSEPDEIHAFSRDGKFLLLRHGGAMSVWNAANGALVLSGAASESHRKFNGGEFSPDGKKFGRGETNGQFAIYDLTITPPTRIAQWPLPDGLVCATAAWSADGTALALVLGSRTLALCDAETGRVRWRRNYAEMIWNITWNNARNWLVVESGDDRVLLLAADDGHEVDHLNLLANGTPVARLSPDGNFLAASGEDFGTHIFDAATRRKLVADPAPAWHLQFNPTGTRLGSLLDRKRPLWLEWQPPLVQRAWRSPGQLDINESLAFSPDGGRLASLTGDGPVVREVATGNIVVRIALQHTRSLAFDAQGQLLCLTDTALLAVELPKHAGPNLSVPHRLLAGKNLKGLDQAEDGSIAVGDLAGAAVHLPGQAGWKKIQLPIHPLRVAISPDGHWLACGAYLNENVYVADVMHPDRPAVKLSGAGNYGVFSPDKKRLFTFGNTIRVWSVGDWRSLPGLPAKLNDAEQIIATISRDGRWLAATQRDHEVELIELATGKVAASLNGLGEGGILSLAFSPDGATLVIARDRGNLQLWSLPRLHSELRRLGLDW